MPFGKKKKSEEKAKEAMAYPTTQGASGGYPAQASQVPPLQQYGAPPPYGQGPPPPYAAAAPPAGQAPAYYPPAPQGYAPQGYAPQGFAPQGAPYQPPPQGSYPAAPRQQGAGNTTVVMQGGFDAGARFDGISQPNVPPPPPGCMPNAAQMAMNRGNNVVVSQRPGNFWDGGSDGGYVMF